MGLEEADDERGRLKERARSVEPGRQADERLSELHILHNRDRKDGTDVCGASQARVDKSVRDELCSLMKREFAHMRLRRP